MAEIFTDPPEMQPPVDMGLAEMPENPGFEQPEDDIEAKPEPIGVLREIMGMDNVAEAMDEGELSEIAQDVLSEYEIDKASMAGWFDRMEDGLKLARMNKEERESVGKASNVLFPLVTSAALQFNARAYPAIVPPSGPVAVQVHGEDPDGLKAARAKRVQEHMSWQVREQIPEWETGMDTLLTLLPVVGTMVRKIWYDPGQDRCRVQLCEAGRVIINDKVNSLDAAPRISEEMFLYPHEIEERKRAGLFLDVDLGLAKSDADDKDAAHEFIEQHRRMDLDEDGYAEPYVVTVHKEKNKVVRIVANFGEDEIHVDNPQMGENNEITGDGVTAIRSRDYYVPYHFLPPLDGGFWGTGLGLLLGDLSHAVNSTINILVDAGHRNSMGGGFIGAQNFRLKGGPQRFDFGEWKQLNFTGNDIRIGIVPLQFPEPSMVLFQMLGLLIESAREIASIKDIVTGEMSHNMTATTTLALIEQGTAVFTAAYKRIFRSLAVEFRLLARNNVEYLTEEEYALFHDKQQAAPQQMPQGMPPEMAQQGMPQQPPISAKADYDLRDMDISPAADPRQVTSAQKMGRAQLLLELAAQGVIDPQEATRRALEAAQIDGIDELLPEPDPMQMQLAQRQAEHADTMMAAERMKAEVEIAEMLAKIDEMMAGASKDRASAQKDLAEVGLKARGQDLEAMKMRAAALMEFVKNGSGRPGPMAGQPDNGVNPIDSAAAGQIPQEGNLGNILGGGQPVPGMGGPGEGDGATFGGV